MSKSNSHISAGENHVLNCAWPDIGRVSADSRIENEFLRAMVLPELGGRIHILQDMTNGYDLIYSQPVIKPALVGLAGRGFLAALNSTGRSIIVPRLFFTP